MKSLRVEFNVPVTLRDGVVLRASLFRPDDDAFYPVALCRTPYNKDSGTAKLPGSTGRVGICGASYVGFTQWAAASESPPSLKALMPVVTWRMPMTGCFVAAVCWN